MKRRDFITLLGGAAAWPYTAVGQATAKVARVGILCVARANPTTAPSWRAFIDELSAHGFRLDDNLLVDMRWVDEGALGPQQAAAELARSSVDVLVVEGQEANLKAAVAATRTIPIVMTVGNYDPVARGYIKSLARPGGNVTGLFLRRLEAAEKQVDLLTQAFPGRTRLGILWDEHSADQFGAAEVAAKTLSLGVHGHKLEGSPYDIDAAFRARKLSTDASRSV